MNDSKPEALSDEEIVTILEQMRERSDMGTELSQNRAKALDYFYCRPRGDEITGRSSVQSADVADMVHAILAQTLPSFTGDKICEFEPDGPNDEPQARLETDATNRALMESSRGYIEIQAAIKDALLLRGAILKGWVEDLGKGRRALRVKAVDPTNFGVDADHDSPILADCAFCWERKAYMRGELSALGFDDEEINKIPNRSLAPSADSQKRAMQAGIGPNINAGWAVEYVDIYEIHAKLDCKGTGEAELYRFLMGEKVLLLKEPAEFIPYATGAAWLESHSFWGLSVYDLIKHIQDLKTGALRQFMDNLMTCNFARAAGNERVVWDDFLKPRAGGGIRVDGAAPVQDSLMPLPVVDTSAGSLGLLQYANQVRAERAGASLDIQQSNAQLLKSQAGADNIGTILGNAEMISAMVARNLAETLIRSAFMLVHRLLRTEYGQPLMLRYSDQWIKADPRKWRPRDRVNIKAGLSPTERKNKAGNLQGIMEGILRLAGMGMDGVLVGPDNIYNAFMDWAAASDIDGPEKYIINPAGEKSRQAAGMKASQAQQSAQVQQMMAQQAHQLAIQAQALEGMRVKIEAADKLAERKFKYWEARLNAEIKEAELIGTATADLERIELEGAIAAANPGGNGDDNSGGGGARQGISEQLVPGAQ